MHYLKLYTRQNYKKLPQKLQNSKRAVTKLKLGKSAQFKRFKNQNENT